MNWMRFFSLMVVIGVLVAGCAPTQTPTPTAPPMSPAPVIAVPPTATPSPQDTAWAEVVRKAREEGSVTVYGYVFAGEVGRAVAEALKDRYGIKLEALAVAGRTALEKVRVEQAIKNPVADVVMGGFSVCWDLAVLNLVDKVVDQLPELRDRNAFKTSVVDFGEQIIYFAFSQSDLLLNSKQVRPEYYPKSYHDLLDPKWKGGKILLSDPRTGANSTWNQFATSIFYKALDLDYYRRLIKQQPVLNYSSPVDVALGVGRGEYVMSLQSVDSVAHLIREGAPLKFLALKEGSWAVGTCEVVIKNAAHPNAARLLANWFMSKEGQEVYHKAANGTPVRKDLPDFMSPGTRPEPQKLFLRTVEVQEAAVKLFKAGIVEEVFTPK